MELMTGLRPMEQINLLMLHQNDCLDPVLHHIIDRGNAVYPKGPDLDRLGIRGQGVHDEIMDRLATVEVLHDIDPLDLVPAVDQEDDSDPDLVADPLDVMVEDGMVRGEEVMAEDVIIEIVVIGMVHREGMEVVVIWEDTMDGRKERGFIAERDAFIAEKWDIGLETVRIWMEGDGASTAGRMVIWPDRVRRSNAVFRDTEARRPEDSTRQWEGRHLEEAVEDQDMDVDRGRGIGLGIKLGLKGRKRKRKGSAIGNSEWI